jgi:hypothetical protein
MQTSAFSIAPSITLTGTDFETGVGPTGVEGVLAGVSLPPPQADNAAATAIERAADAARGCFLRIDMI